MIFQNPEYSIEIIQNGNFVVVTISTIRLFSSFFYDIVVDMKRLPSKVVYTLKGLSISKSIQNSDGPATYRDSILIPIDETTEITIELKNAVYICLAKNKSGTIDLEQISK